MRRAHAAAAPSPSPRRQAATLELSIHGDEQEAYRIQLEHNLQHTDLSLHLSSADNTDDHSLEYARHNSVPSPGPVFASFDRDTYDHEGHSNLHAWSYRTGDDDEGVHPYGGESLSTAAHHASALTLSAGLAGRGARRDVSMSGAEYDPERPLQDIMAGIGTRFSSLGLDTTRSKYPNADAVGFDPHVMDSTMELDRVLGSGRPGTPLHDFRSPRSSAPSTPTSARSPSLHGAAAARPKLADHLHRATFSPKRPRSALANHSPQAGRPSTPSQLRTQASVSAAPPDSPSPQNLEIENDPTPRPRHKSRSSTSAAQQQQHSPLPAVQLQPPTPSSTTANSTFTKMARGLGREIASERSRRSAATTTHAQVQDPNNTVRARSRENVPEGPAAQSTIRPHGPGGARHAFRDVANRHAHAHRSVSFDVPNMYAAANVSTKSHKSRVHLPDVTGLTSAVMSPARMGREYRAYKESEAARHRESEARLMGTLNAVQSKLANLEAENSISRRRVRELEIELEACKQDVARERTRVLEQEDIVVRQQQRRAAEQAQYDDRRYKEVVEEKKALESLITSLRAHLARLTAELSTHQELLEELRALRESDALALKEKCQEVDRLRDEVERLSGEVEVLRSVVEEGLKERRAVREEHSRLSGITERTEDEADGDVTDDERADRSCLDLLDASRIESVSEDEESEDEDDGRAVLQDQRQHQHQNAADRTMRTDHATAGSGSPQSHVANPNGSPPFITDEELDRISVEMDERRSERSLSAGSRADSVRSEDCSVDEHSEEQESTARQARPPSAQGRRREERERPASRQSRAPPTAASRSDATGQRPPAGESRAPAPGNKGASEAPFPQIRGTHLESLFFAAPEHNAETCTVCHRRRRPGAAAATNAATASWLRGHMATGTKGADKGKRREGHEEDRLPPQTVLVRVLRELEDDFTHYKGIYMELAEQYGLMDAAANVPKRNVLAQHLREVIDCLEQKGDQIASLYDLLTFKDKPTSESVVPDRPDNTRRAQAQPRHDAAAPSAFARR